MTSSLGNLCGLGLVLAFAFALPSGASAAQATQTTNAPAIARPLASPNKVLMAHCCHAHPLPPYDGYCCHAPVAPVYGYGYAAGGYYGPAGVVGSTRRVARRTARRVGRRH